MALATYSDLIAAIAIWADRDDLSAVIPSFIRLAEARLTRVLTDPKMEVRARANITGEYLPLPEDFGGMRSVHLEGSPDRPLDQRPAGELYMAYPSGSGVPRAFAIADEQLILAPVATSGVIEMIYWRTLPALSDAAPVNWLLAVAPDIYLFGALAELESYIQNDARVALWRTRQDAGLEELAQYGNRQRWGAAPIYPRTAPPCVGARV
jgi:hypothetical protein